MVDVATTSCRVIGLSAWRDRDERGGKSRGIFHGIDVALDRAMRRLLHRWFVQYNPLYLLSAALVLRGVNVVSRELLERGHVIAELAGPAIAEIYAWSLIGGAAILFRRGLRRPAVMLIVLAVLYQGDLTLHTETCIYLGGIGWIASAVWLTSFALKLAAIGRALELRIARGTFAAPIIGAVGLVLVPRMLSGPVVSVWLFALLAAFLFVPRRIAIDSDDPWHQTVLRRARIATWSIWAVLVALHVAFWFSIRRMDAATLLPVSIVIAARFVRRDWIVAAIAFAMVLVFGPLAGAFGAIAFALRSIRARDRSPLVAGLPSVSSAVVTHWAIQVRIITAPVSALEWGWWSTGTGFVLLALALLGSLRFKSQAT
jgi:hypothetical protein